MDVNIPRAMMMMVGTRKSRVQSNLALPDGKNHWDPVRFKLP